MNGLPAFLLALGALAATGCSDSSAARGDAARAETAARARTADEQALRAELVQRRAELEELRRANAELGRQLEAAESRAHGLQAELQAEQAARIAREEEWLRFTQGIRELSLAAGVSPPDFPQPAPAGPEAAAPAPAPPDPRALARAERSRAIHAALRALFTLDEIDGLDLLESGELGEGAIGPVVLRMLDAAGRPTGVLCAERMHLEASRAARTLTLVFDQGYERRGGVRTPFPEAGTVFGPVTNETSEALSRRGTRRIELPEIDPQPWIERVPELFAPEARAPVIDDGQHDLTALRVALNLLLREDASGGWWRLAGLGGVQQGVLRDVQLEGFDREGTLERRLFADRLAIVEEPRGLRLSLEDGAQMRGDRKTPFLDGRYRLILPRADVAAWIRAGLPVQRLAAAPVPGPKQD